MNDRTSLLKARYCLSVLATAAIGPDKDARRLVHCLATESPTTLTSAQVGVAERNALAAVRVLSERIQEYRVSPSTGDWKLAKDAISRWIDLATEG